MASTSNTKITEITNKAACAEWCPVQAGLAALGSKDSSGSGFDSSGGELELYAISITGEEPDLKGSLETKARFASLAWSSFTNDGAYPAGLLAGGMADGSILLFDPQAIMDGDGKDKILGTVPAKPSSGPINAMQFSSLDVHNLCAGAFDGKIAIVDCTNPASPIVSEPGAAGQQSAAEITAVAWNTAVAHIVATAAGDGSVTVWDIQSHKAWCEIRAEHAGQAVADIAWNPAQGLHLLTASADDRNPVLRVWDLGASTSVPLATLTGHSAGLFRAAWCPHDDSLLVSVAKDNRTLLWDLQTLAAVAELPMDVIEQNQQQQQNTNSAGALFASGRPGLAEQKSMRYDIQWSPFQRGVALTCSLDKKVQVHSLLALATCAGRPPAWMKPASSVSTGFGGMLISCGSGTGSTVTIRTIQEKPKLAKTSHALESELAAHQETIIEFCKIQQEKAVEPEDQALWGFMQVIFEANARQELLEHLGFNAEEIAAAANDYSDDLSNGVASMSLKDEKHKGPMSQAAQDMVKQALFVGNFEAAVECCFKSEQYADALMLASCSGNAELWSNTQERFFASESSKRPYLSLVSGIVRNQLNELVADSNLSAWQETLAVLATYAQSEEFPNLCVALGDRLQDADDASSASLCYMCAMNLERSVVFWKTQLDKKTSSSDFSTESDLLALHEFVVKVSVFVQAAGSYATLTPEIEELFTKYAQALAEEGLLVNATKYCKGSTTVSKVLRDRLYRSRASQRCYAVLGSPPEFPYEMPSIEQSRGQVMAQPKIQQPDAQTNGHPQDQQQNYGQEQQPQQQSHGQQQPQQQQQSYAQSNQYGQQNHQAQNYAGNDDQLPLGWVALQDPGSGSTYYANQTTGETTWDKPQAAVPATVPQPAYSVPQPAMQDSGVDDSSQRSAHTNQSSTSKQKSALVSKYGDGFVSSASNPELAYQYGNVGTSNPYGETARPGTAAAVLQQQAESKAPVSGTMNFDSLELSHHHSSIKDTLLDTTAAIKGAQLNPVEKRQIAEAEKGVAILVKKLARNDLSDETMQQVVALVGAIAVGDFGTAAAAQTTLANTEWREHKDWLKGIKILIQLGSKKL